MLTVFIQSIVDGILSKEDSQGETCIANPIKKAGGLYMRLPE